jgi:hypothetical protein
MNSRDRIAIEFDDMIDVALHQPFEALDQPDYARAVLAGSERR